MKSEVLIQTERATLEYVPDGNIVHHRILQPLQGPAFRELLNKGAELFEKRGVRKWLSDDRGNGALHPDDAQWGLSEWSPRVIRAGWKWWAIVMPDAALGRINMKRFINKYRDDGVTVEIFDDPSAALAWLRSVD